MIMLCIVVTVRERSCSMNDEKDQDRPPRLEENFPWHRIRRMPRK